MPHRRTCARREEDRGAIAVTAALLFVPLALTLAVVMDVARVWVVRERLQNGVEAVATASAVEWSTGGSPCSARARAMLTADGSTTAHGDCVSTTRTSAKIVTVSATEDVSLRFASILGRRTVTVRAGTGVKVTPAGSTTGLWPFALCADNDAVSSWVNSGFTANVSTTITFHQPNELCRGSVSGNWAVIDFDGGSSSNSETKFWVDNGYTGVIHVGDILQGSPGAPSGSLDITSAIGREILLPLYRYPIGTGSGARYTVVGLARARVDGVNLSGGESKRSLSITFLGGTTKPGAGSDDGPDFGLYKWSVCSVDQYGVC